MVPGWGEPARLATASLAAPDAGEIGRGAPGRPFHIQKLRLIAKSATTKIPAVRSRVRRRMLRAAFTL
jgi:hypothetical protein